ncbi:DUF2243 domain-containing protein [Pontibacter qinzhouensis]|uniref:DUF2243 domain-containing protein n=1 Tax=Pontibacter qinzhouensis TaxID=2603253 RepID=A0A5C8JK13_9BACT|nr:DUF2243 domain-containing protein [Pontibacter qinzhouensis]TXK37014.1 DUF2243 domain-containing protein [Pontibacter qinzhouensis]
MQEQQPATRASGLTTGPLVAAAALIGIGMGGFIDGIVLHQILQWHQMLTAKIPATTVLNKEVNMFWDGIFHSFTWLTTAAGIYRLWRLVFTRKALLSNKLFAGGLLLGWGLFNVVEGILDHHVLVLHNVRELSANTDAWNYGFLILSFLMLAAGWFMIQAERKRLKVY